LNTVEFIVEGSKGDLYRVVFKKDKNELYASCSCPAGTRGLFCKHRRDLLLGNSKSIVSGNEKQIGVIRTWLHGSNLEKALLELEEAEKEYVQVKKRLSHAKERISRIVRDKTS
jgi:hypothetical protein